MKLLETYSNKYVSIAFVYSNVRYNYDIEDKLEIHKVGKLMFGYTQWLQTNKYERNVNNKNI